MAGSDIGDHRRDEQRRNPLSGRIFYDLLGLLELNFKTTDARTDIHAETEGIDVGIFAFGLEPRILHCLIGCGYTVLGEKGLLAHEGLVHPILQGIEILDLGCDMHRQQRSIEFSDCLNATDSVLKVVPERGDIVSDSGNDSKACDYYSVFFHIK